MTATKKPAIDAYTQHHLNILTDKGKECIAECLWCGKPKLFVNKTTGLHQCKVCGEKGNLYTFLEFLWTEARKDTKATDFKQLEKYRDLPAQAFRDLPFAYDRLMQRWLLLIRNGEGKVSNLKYVDLSMDKPRLYGTATCGAQLFLQEELAPEGPVYLCEGEWDAVALRWLLTKTKSPGSVIGVPGSATWKPPWTAMLHDRDVVVLYDAGSAGQEGQRRVVEALTPKSKSVKVFQWPSETPDNTDINDLISANRKAPVQTWKDLQECFRALKEKRVPKIQRDSFEAVVQDYKTVLEWNPYLEEALAVSFATILSANVYSSNPLWVYLYGPSGCGKSTLLLSYRGFEGCEYVSKLTNTNLVSGMKMEDGSDPSILSRLEGKDKCLVVKDYTVMSDAPEEMIKGARAVLRDSYDGFYRTPYGNGEVREYNNLHFSVLAGVTDIVHKTNDSSLGPRFLKVDAAGPYYDYTATCRQAMRNVRTGVKVEEALMDSATAFLAHSRDYSSLPGMSRAQEDKLIGLCQYVALMRAQVERTKDGELYYHPRAEVASRLCVQLTKLALALCFVYNVDDVDDRTFNIIHRIGIDTAYGSQQEVAKALFNIKRPVTIDELEDNVKVSRATIDRRLQDLLDLNGVKRTAVATGKRGRKAFMWELTDYLKSQMEEAFR